MFRAVTEYIKKIDFHHILISLKSRNFRLYFGGMCVSLVGTWIQQIAMSWLVYKLTGSLFLLAMVTFMSQIPILLITPFVSVFVDRIDKRKILPAVHLICRIPGQIDTRHPVNNLGKPRTIDPIG